MFYMKYTGKIWSIQILLSTVLHFISFVIKCYNVNFTFFFLIDIIKFSLNTWNNMKTQIYGTTNVLPEKKTCFCKKKLKKAKKQRLNEKYQKTNNISKTYKKLWPWSNIDYKKNPDVDLRLDPIQLSPSKVNLFLKNLISDRMNIFHHEFFFLLNEK